jgi:putative drug exporter of the RND superfamily
MPEAVNLFSRLIGWGARHPWTTIVAWAVILLLLAPVALSYTSQVNYGQSSYGLTGSESARASALLNEVGAQNSTLLVVTAVGSPESSSAANRTFGFENAVAAAHLPHFAAVRSAYSAYAGYLDGVFGPEVPTVRSLYPAVANLSAAIYALPARFLAAWTADGATRASINTTFDSLNGSSAPYGSALRAALWENFSAAAAPSDQIESAVRATAPGYFPPSPMRNATLTYASVANYTGATAAIVSALLSPLGGPPVPVSWVAVAAAPGDFGRDYVQTYGLVGVPSGILSQYLSPDLSLSLVVVIFDVSDSYRTPAGVFPAQSATPIVRELANTWFGPSERVTGAGAAAADAQALQSSAGVLFALVFVLLAVAVAVTLRSWVAPFLAILFVSLSTVLGYLAIVATGIWFEKVDFTATYTLTAVTLGIATDYLLFLVYRYREELTRGVPREEALRVASERSGFAVIVSAGTVAVGLGALSFLPGLETWGPVLALTVLATALLTITLLPALLRLIGPRVFARRWMTPARPVERSLFYRAARRSTTRPWLVLVLAALVAGPAVASFVLVPTTYNISAGVPASTPSAQGLALVEQKFGANLLYPTYVVVTSPSSYLTPNGSLSPEAIRDLPQVAERLLGYSGVSSVVGPFVTGRNLSGPTGAVNFVFGGGAYAYFLVYSDYGPYSTGALGLVHALRGNVSFLVGGLTSSVIDQQQQNGVEYPIFEAVLAALIGLLLAVAFRSGFIPLISLSGVFLSISVTTGLLYGIATYLLHQPLLYLVPLILFVILMSLGNDYTVFLLARVREESRVTGPREGIHRGIAGSGVVVSALGLILAASLGSLALQPLTFLQELGIAFIVSLVIDTFLIRPFYFPALLALSERRTWPPSSRARTEASASLAGLRGE